MSDAGVDEALPLEMLESQVRKIEKIAALGMTSISPGGMDGSDRMVLGNLLREGRVTRTWASAVIAQTGTFTEAEIARADRALSRIETLSTALLKLVIACLADDGGLPKKDDRRYTHFPFTQNQPSGG